MGIVIRTGYHRQEEHIGYIIARVLKELHGKIEISQQRLRQEQGDSSGEEEANTF